MRTPEARTVNFLGAAACAAMLLYAIFYVQRHLGLEPCPLCIFQRVTIAFLGVFFLIAALHGARNPSRYIYAFLIGLASSATVAVASRHVYIQAQPPGSVPACGAPLAAMIQFMPFTDVLKKVLKGGGECAKIDWTFLGLAMPWWVMFCALALGMIGVWANTRRA
jgi:protein dithiol:quinone oxidoreductase